MLCVIDVMDLTMRYRVPLRNAGLRAAARSLFRRTYREITALQALSLQLAAGEVVGFLGPNGAGKTTTLKILSGILHPTDGTVRVLNFTPWRREPAFLKSIALVRGSQPIGGPTELTLLDALRFQQLLYEVAESDFRRHLALLVEMLDLEALLRRQMRALSLGERMRCGLALALIYRPRVLFLDEPTLGLDVSAVQLMRRFIADYSHTSGATVLLTSHYMADVEALCKRIVLIDQGRVRYDGELEGLSTGLAAVKVLKVAIADATTPTWQIYGEVVEEGPGRATLHIPRARIAEVTARLLTELSVRDLAIENPPLERVIDRLYAQGREQA